jgi:hypothetical protein
LSVREQLLHARSCPANQYLTPGSPEGVGSNFSGYGVHSYKLKFKSEILDLTV